VGWRHIQVCSNTLGHDVVSDFGVENQVERSILFLVTSCRVRVEANGTLVLQKVVVLTRVLEPVRNFETG
jgi:hypothetical protein